jgi:NO-binding membrane sensor protein with MHYT domain
VLTGLGVVGMHYTGMLAMRVYGTISYDPRLVGASVGVAVVAATVALWFTVTVGSWGRIAVASVVMALAVCGMHYTGMAAIQVRLHESGIHHVQGVNPMQLLVPIVLITSAALIGMAFSGLKAMTEEEFAAPPHPSAGGRHAETPFTVALRPGGETL